MSIMFNIVISISSISTISISSISLSISLSMICLPASERGRDERGFHRGAANPLHFAGWLVALCKPVQSSDSELSDRRLTLRVSLWVSPEKEETQKIPYILP